MSRVTFSFRSLNDCIIRDLGMGIGFQIQDMCKIIMMTIGSTVFGSTHSVSSRRKVNAFPCLSSILLMVNLLKSQPIFLEKCETYKQNQNLQFSMLQTPPPLQVEHVPNFRLIPNHPLGPYTSFITLSLSSRSVVASNRILHAMSCSLSSLNFFILTKIFDSFRHLDQIWRNIYILLSLKLLETPKLLMYPQKNIPQTYFMHIHNLQPHMYFINHLLSYCYQQSLQLHHQMTTRTR